MCARVERRSRRPRWGLALLASLALGACSGLNDPIAGYDNVLYHSALFSLNQSPLGAPTAINTATALTVRTEITYEFDVAFDIDQSGRPVVYTQRAVGLPQNAIGHSVSLQKVTTPFESLLEAPSRGWVPDSLLTVDVGETFVVRAQAGICQLYGSPYLYSKAMVDSVNTSTRQIWLTVFTDPNCGFRSFVNGRPTH